MKILIVTLGSVGDLLPFLVVGLALRARGHEVIIGSNAGYETLVRTQGFGFRALWDRTPAHTLDDLLASDPDAAWRMVRDAYAGAAQPTYDWIAGAGKCVVLAAWSAQGAVLAHNKLQVPLCQAYLSPHAIDLAAGDGARGAQVAFFPGWFCDPKPNWPAQLQMTGFPITDDAVQPSLPAELEQFLAAGDRPVIFTPGTFMRHAERFFRESLAACSTRNLRAVFLTPYQAQLPANLPPTVRHFQYISLQKLLPHAAALVSHGGIGTCGQAMRAGTPQLLSPVFFDQFDNAARIESLGIGESIPANQYRAEVAAEALDRLLQSDAVAKACACVAAHFQVPDPVADICNIVEALG